MAFTVKTRGAGGMMVAEYLCPVHGRFEELVERDGNGDAPPTRVCMETTGRTERFHHFCGQISQFAISAPRPKVLSVPVYAAQRGGDMKERPPGMLDTRPLAEGMPLAEWKKVQQKHAQERRHKQLIEKGLKTRRVQSP